LTVVWIEPLHKRRTSRIDDHKVVAFISAIPVPVLAPGQRPTRADVGRPGAVDLSAQRHRLLVREREGLLLASGGELAF
ncbi:MAG: hypothetical protein AAF321_07055, partial [Pseudomonadota bacterium]